MQEFTHTSIPNNTASESVTSIPLDMVIAAFEEVGVPISKDTEDCEEEKLDKAEEFVAK